jgi:hypothetical protein
VLAELEMVRSLRFAEAVVAELEMRVGSCSLLKKMSWLFNCREACSPSSVLARDWLKALAGPAKMSWRGVSQLSQHLVVIASGTLADEFRQGQVLTVHMIL